MIEIREEMCRNHGVITNGCVSCGANTEAADVKEIRIMPDYGGSGVTVTLCKSCRKELHDLLAEENCIEGNRATIVLGSPGVGMTFHAKKELLSKFVTSKSDANLVVTDTKDAVTKLKEKYSLSAIDIVNRETGEYGCVHCRTVFDDDDFAYVMETGICQYCHTSLE